MRYLSFNSNKSLKEERLIFDTHPFLKFIEYFYYIVLIFTPLALSSLLFLFQLNNENFISIENGFVKTDGEFWYDIAYIFIKINNEIYAKYSHRRNFPKDIYNNTNQLVKYFEKNNDTRYNQLYYCIKDIINDIFNISF